MYFPDVLEAKGRDVHLCALFLFVNKANIKQILNWVVHAKLPHLIKNNFTY